MLLDDDDSRLVAEHTSDADLAQGSLYPPLNGVRAVSAHIAAAVAEIAYRHGYATLGRPDDLLGFMRAQMYDPDYASYV
jgi:malate dehydrogenase (oxaloacetate-decarboxylating)(NADP+)